MTQPNHDLNVSVSHISLMHRPYGPRMHLDEGAAGGSQAAAPTAPAASAPAAEMPDSFSDARAAVAWLAKKDQTTEQPAERADPATAATELSVEDNADPAAEPSIGEDEGSDPAAEPPIARPKSWTEAEDAEWRATPRALQEKIAARELERDQAIRRAQNEAADKLKGLTAKEQAAEQARQNYEAKLPELMAALHKTNNTAFADITSQDDADLLAQLDPARYVQWMAHQQRMASINSELQHAESGKAAKQQAEWTEFRNREDALATEKIPDLANPEKADKLMKRAAARLTELGFKPEELNDLISGKQRIAVVDHRFQQLIFDSLKLADIQAAKAKVTAAAKPLPPVSRPGTSAQSSRGESALQAATRAFNLDPNPRNAAALATARRAASSNR